jgi:hypothetical protein
MGLFFKKASSPQPEQPTESKSKTPYQKGYESAMRGSQRKAGVAKARFDMRYNSYPKTKTGAFNRILNISTAPARERTSFLYGRAPMTSSGRSSHPGGRGRPKGTYDPRYAKYGGVYGYRKMLNYQLRVQRLEAMRRASVSPQQQNVINQFEQRQQMQRVDPERQVIPDIRGYSPLGSFNNEVDDAANLVS